MTKVISFRVSDKQHQDLMEEAASIPRTLSKHMKDWILNRNEILQDEYNHGVEACKKSIVSE